MYLHELYEKYGVKRVTKPTWGSDMWFMVCGRAPVGALEFYGFTERGNGVGYSDVDHDWILALKLKEGVTNDTTDKQATWDL